MAEDVHPMICTFCGASLCRHAHTNLTGVQWKLFLELIDLIGMTPQGVCMIALNVSVNIVFVRGFQSIEKLFPQ